MWYWFSHQNIAFQVCCFIVGLIILLYVVDLLKKRGANIPTPTEEEKDLNDSITPHL